MKMPKVSECQVDGCAYNASGMCHAMAITIGDMAHPQCDTFCPESAKGGDESCVAAVGACKTSSCMHNAKLECQASDIQVGYVGSEPDCLTFSTG